MATWNYDTLVDDLRLMVDRTESDSDFTTALPSIFEDAERRIVREVPISVFHTDEGSVFVMGTPLIARPSNLIATEYLRYSVNGTYRNLRLRPAAWLDEWHPTPAVTGPPRYIALLDSGSYKIAPPPDQGYSYTLGYRRHTAFLGPDQPTNILTQEYPDLLRAALYARASLFLRNDDGQIAAEMQKHEANYAAIKQSIYSNEHLAQGTTFEDGVPEKRAEG